MGKPRYLKFVDKITGEKEDVLRKNCDVHNNPVKFVAEY